MGLTLFYISALLALVVAIIIAVRFWDSIFSRWRSSGWTSDRRVGAIAIATWTAGPIIAVIAPVFGFSGYGSMLLLFAIISSVGAIAAARYTPSKWWLLVPVGVLVPALWAFSYAAAVAFQSGWQGLDIKDVTPGDQGEGAQIIFIAAVGTVLAPLWGIVLGTLSRIKLRAVDVPPGQGQSA